MISRQLGVTASGHFPISACWELEGPDQFQPSPLTDHRGLGVPRRSGCSGVASSPGTAALCRQMPDRVMCQSPVFIFV